MNILGFYGCGHIGKAILKNLLKKGILPPKKIIASTKSKESAQKIQKEFHISTTNDVYEIQNCEYILLGFKPQTLPDIPKIQGKKIIISILAGTNICTLKKTFPACKIVRAMPNLPIQYGQGMSALFFEKEAIFSAEEKNFIQSIFESGGKIMELKAEDQMHAFTALCGSSPAYLLYFMEKLSKQAQKLKFTPKQSYEMASQVLLGTASMIQNQKDPQTFKIIREKISSRKGITECAIQTFASEENHLIEKILKSAIQRSKSLS